MVRGLKKVGDFRRIQCAFDDDMKAAPVDLVRDFREVDQLVKFARRLYQHYERDLLKWLKENPLDEYKKECNRKHINVGGWILKRK